MSYILVKFSASWADEFECEELLLVEGTLESVTARLEEFLEEGYYDHEYDEYYTEFSFGTNESFQLEDLSLSDFSLTELLESEAECIKTHIGSNFGTGILSQIF